jgi:Predicted nucleic-acid-binding protein implicated in transcription termination
MKVRKIPMRTCAVSMEKYPKMELIRVVRTPEGTVEVDLTGKKNGHGVYIKRDLDIIKKAEKTKKLERSLECEVPLVIYEELVNIINNES